MIDTKFRIATRARIVYFRELSTDCSYVSVSRSISFADPDSTSVPGPYMASSRVQLILKSTIDSVGLVGLSLTVSCVFIFVAPATEISEYLREVAKRYSLYDHISFNTSVEKAIWNEDDKI